MGFLLANELSEIGLYIDEALLGIKNFKVWCVWCSDSLTLRLELAHNYIWIVFVAS